MHDSFESKKKHILLKNGKNKFSAFDINIFRLTCVKSIQEQNRKETLIGSLFSL